MVGRLFLAPARYLEECNAGEVLMSPADISWGGLPDILFQPDLFVVPQRFGPVREWTEVALLALVIEVQSPTTAGYDRFTKRRLYEERGVPLYWLIDLEAPRAEVWTPGATLPAHEEHVLRWQPAGATDALSVDLASIFAQ